jgi:hypothetical protein
MSYWKYEHLPERSCQQRADLVLLARNSNARVEEVFIEFKRVLGYVKGRPKAYL